MKLAFEKRGTKEYYNEILYVAKNYKKIVNNPHKRLRNLSNQYLLLLIPLIIVYIIYPIFSQNELLFGLGLAIVTLCLAMYFRVRKAVNFYLNDKGKKSIEINKESVIYADDTKTYYLKWDNISYITVNKCSICFIPHISENTLPIIITVPIEYKSDILNAIDKYDKNQLIIDNSSLYKQ